MIWVRVKHLPRESATQIFLNDGVAWGWIEILLSDIWAIFAGKPHPSRPKPQAKKDRTAGFEEERQRRVARKRRRARAKNRDRED